MLVGNWSDDYSMGTAPTAWIGSVKILQQYANTGVPVCFAQCWVFAGVFNTCKLCLARCTFQTPRPWDTFYSGGGVSAASGLCRVNRKC